MPLHSIVFSLLLSICQCPRAVLPRHQGRLLADRYLGRNTASPPQWELAGKTIGIIGYGHIGPQVWRELRRALGMQVLVNTRTVRPEYASDGVTFLPLDELLSSSDIVTLHCIATDETRGMINDATLAKMKPRCRP